MGSKDRREREREETRARILDAARELFARAGVEAVTMRAIADRIEYTPTAIYHHFQDKNALILELCHTDFLTLAAALRKIGRIDDPLERLRRIGYAYVDFALSHPNHYRIMFMTSTPPADERMRLHKGNPEEDAYEFLKQTVAEVIRSGRLRPELSDAEDVAQIAWAAAHGVVSLHLAKSHETWVDWRDAGETARLMIDVFVRGITRPEV